MPTMRRSISCSPAPTREASTRYAGSALGCRRRHAVASASAITGRGSSNDIFLSAASIWEITIKYALNRGRPTDMPVSGPQALAHFMAAGYAFLSVTGEHAAAVSRLPDLHRDPFDRIIVAQALYEPLRLITHDAQVGAYSDSIELV